MGGPVSHIESLLPARLAVPRCGRRAGLQVASIKRDPTQRLAFIVQLLLKSLHQLRQILFRPVDPRRRQRFEHVLLRDEDNEMRHRKAPFRFLRVPSPGAFRSATRAIRRRTRPFRPRYAGHSAAAPDPAAQPGFARIPLPRRLPSARPRTATTRAHGPLPPFRLRAASSSAQSSPPPSAPRPSSWSAPGASPSPPSPRPPPRTPRRPPSPSPSTTALAFR